MNNTIRNIAFFVFVILLQVLALNNVNESTFINPYIFPLIILSLPYDTKPWITLLTAFSLGLFMDLFTGTPGMHAFSLVLMTFIRPALVKVLSLDKLDSGSSVNLKTQDTIVVLSYTLISLFVFHLSDFTLELFSFKNIFHILIKTVSSTLVSFIISIILLFIFKSSTKNER